MPRLLLAPQTEHEEGEAGGDATHRDADPDAEKAEIKRRGGWWKMLSSALWDFIADDALTQAGAVAFYTALSFAPLLMLATFVFSNLDHLAGTGTEQRVVGQVQRLMGSEAGQVVEEVRRDQEEQQVVRSGYQTVTGILGILVLIWSASGVFVQLQTGLNRVWDVEQAPEEGLLGWLRSRGLSMTVVFAVLFLLLASLIVTAIINAVFDDGGQEGRGTLLQTVHFVASTGIHVLLFAMIFKFLPDALVPWRVVWLGAATTTLLFVIGQFVIGFYLGRANPGSAYGGAGSLVVLLIWVYYSATILFFGAELTQAWAKRAGLRIEPSRHARPSLSNKQAPANRRSQDENAAHGL